MIRPPTDNQPIEEATDRSGYGCLLDEMTQCLDVAFANLSAARVPAGLALLADSALRLRAATPQPVWRTFITQVCHPHPITELLHQDPLTWRSFAKPRGYPGDAVLMDLICGLGDADLLRAAATPLGREILAYGLQRQGPRAVRYRRRFAAQLIDAHAKRVRGLRILSVGCGHLREADLSAALRDGELDELVALDQDEWSLDEIARSYGALRVRPMPGTIQDLLRDRLPVGTFDLVYALGLFDYLPGATARRLVQRLTSLLRPAGRLVIVNFTPELPDIGYMEAFMGWELIYRDEAAIGSLILGGPDLRHRVYRDSSRNLVFFEVERVESN